ncbi:hypothetical protein DPMN_012336 [Dreissena polymorpha]|uniref:Uncharacterized protein n=1 Tax=Dreissena polymorpha TaxID=45954 RepID=A0A9D4N6U4_DREPO|nr:hypothetical protein DPMN_012336 [Dreissena polymorpha]
MATDDFAEYSCDGDVNNDDNAADDDDVDYSPLDKSESHTESLVYPEQGTVTIYMEESSNAIQEDGDKEQVEMGKSSIPLVNVQKEIIHVATSKKTNEGKRIWDKIHVCIYPKLARHLEQVHGNELEVLTNINCYM